MTKTSKPASKTAGKKQTRGSSTVGERRAHAPEVAGSTPAPATNTSARDARSRKAPADSKVPSPRKPRGSGAAVKPTPGHKDMAPAQRRHDWEAIERDYRTGRYSLRELEAKHGPGFADISRRAKRDGWTKDLAQAVREATNAALIAHVTTEVTTKLATPTTDVVKAAAEVSKQVILRHRTDIAEARDAAMDLLSELRATSRSPEQLEALVNAATDGMHPLAAQGLQQAARDAVKLATRVGSVQKLADTLSKLQVLERRAFGLDAEGEDGKGKRPDSGSVYELSDDELLEEIALARAQRLAQGEGADA